MPAWTLKLLGDCALFSPDGRAVRLSTRKSLALLAFLALQPDRRARRQRLSALLWDEADAEQGRLHVRKALWLLRSESARAAPDAPPPVEGDGEWLQIPEGALATDVDALFAAAAAGGQDAASLESAAALYTGDFLGDFAVRNAPAFEDWAQVERQNVREAAIALHRRLLDALAAAPDSGEAAMRAALRLIAIDPLQEHAHRAVMRLHVRQGRAAAALAHYHGLRDTLRRELAVDPEAETRALFAEISASRRVAEKPGESPAPAPEPAAVFEAPAPAVLPTAQAPKPRPRRVRLRYAAAGVAAAALLSLGLARWHPAPAAEAPTVERIFPIPSGLVVSGRPALSPDGSRIAFTARERDAENVDLYLFTIGDSEPIRLTRDEGVDDNAAWSPDGTAIAFTRSTRDGSAPCRIFVMTVPGGAEHPAGACRHARSTRLAWLPGGDALLLGDRASPQGALAIYRMSVADGRSVPLTTPPAELPGDREPVVSADGRTVAFLRATSQESADIFLLDLASSAVRRLTSDSGAIGGLAWSGDDGGLLFSSDRGGDAGLWWIAASGGAPERVSEGLLRYRSLSQARSRERIVFEGVRDRSSLIDAAPGASLEDLTAREAEFRDWFPDVAADGTTLFVSTRNGGEQIWTSRPGERPRQLTQLDGWRIVSPRWSPDGRHIAFAGVHGDTSDLYVVARSGGPPVRLTADAAEDGSPEWSADGRHLYFTSRRSGRPAIWRLAAFGPDRSAARVTPDGPVHARVDRGGRHIYYAYPGRPGLFRRALAPDGAAATGAEEKVLDSLAAVDWANWALSGSAVYWIERPAAVNRGARLKRRDLASGAVQDIADASMLHRRSGFALAPDGHPVLNVQRLKVELYGIDFR
jgi:Tol biopolymer transport system component/DNA-binding SARP family transcriptional activator